eukprot:126633_1
MSSSVRLLLVLHEDSYDAVVQNYAICDVFYFDPLIPKYDRDSTYLLILSSLELTILLSFLMLLCIKNYCIGKNKKRAKAILLPYYDRIVYWYSFITVIRMLFALCQYVMIQIGDLQHIEHRWYISAIESLAQLSMISLELFIALLIMQTSVGQNAFRRAMKRTLIICTIIAILMMFKCLLGSDLERFVTWLLFNISIHGLLLFIYALIFGYACIYQQHVRHMNRKRNKILYIYLAFITFIHSIFEMSYLFEICTIDGFCFMIIAEYLNRVVFPIVAYITIKNDSEFWKNIIYSLQFVRNDKNATVKIHYDKRRGSRATADSFLSGADYRDSMRLIFGNEHYAPIIGALELEINMMKYDDLYDISDPFAMGSTAMVHRATYKDEEVAVKKWIFDEFDLNLDIITEFFRETLFSNIVNPNLVQFKGACLRPPELCLVYEYVNCGDLARLILPCFNSTNRHPNHRDALKIKHRLNILIGIANGMEKLHSEGIIHRDLKTSNVLIKYDQICKQYIAKVCDFGSARKLNAVPFDKENINSNGNVRMTTTVGTIAFMAPELLSRIDLMKLAPNVLQSKNAKTEDDYWLMTEMIEMSETNTTDHEIPLERNKRNIDYLLHHNSYHATKKFELTYTRQKKKDSSIYSKAVDIFSFGILMFEIGFLVRIYQNMDLIKIYDVVTNDKREICIPSYAECQTPLNGFYVIRQVVYDEFVRLMKLCWAQNPKHRPSFKDIKAELNRIQQINNARF